MNNYFYNKSQSLSGILYRKNTMNRQLPSYFQYRLSTQQQTSDKSQKNRINYISPQHKSNSQLNIFKNRFLKGLNNDKNITKKQQPTSHKDTNFKVNQLLIANQTHKKDINYQNIFEPSQNYTKNNYKTIHSFFRQQLSKEYRSPQKKDSMLLTQDQTYSKSKSIMMIRKMNKKKQKYLKNQIKQYQGQIYKKRQVPIHHSQYYFNQQKKKSKTDNTHKKKELQVLNFKTTKIFKEILQIGDPTGQLSPLSRKDSQENLIVIKSPIKGSTIYQARSLQKRLVNKSPVFPKKYSISLPKRKGSKRQPEIQLGPWKRSQTEQFTQPFF